jgi:hypothetical protein
VNVVKVISFSSAVLPPIISSPKFPQAILCFLTSGKFRMGLNQK